MQTNIAIISTLSQEDKSKFIQYLNKKNRRGDTKNIILFKILCNGNTKNLDYEIYGKSSKNALYALNKRLQDSLIDFYASKSFSEETSEELEILKLLLASRLLFEHKKHKTAFKILQKSEEKASKFDLYSILTEIYHTKIQYTHLNDRLDLNSVIEAAKTNLQNFEREQRLNMVYAKIKKDFMKKKEIHKTITKSFSAFNISIDASLSYKSLFQLLSTVMSTASLRSNYNSLTPFLNRIKLILEKKKLLADKNLFYYMQLLNLLAYATFRNKDFASSREYLSELELQLAKGYSTLFTEKTIILNGLLKNYTREPLKAITILSNIKDKSLDALLALAICQFQQKKFVETYSILKKLQHSDAWYEKKVGLMWVIKKKLIEMLVLVELDKLDLFLNRFQAFKRNFSLRLKKMKENRILNFVELVNDYYKNPNEITSVNFKDKVENTFTWKTQEEEDIFVMSFYAWLKAKMEQKDIYEVTLGLTNP